MTDSVSAPTQSRVHRIQLNDEVQYTDSSVFPPVVLLGVVKAFANTELTYLDVIFEDGTTKTLTEDELHRTGGVV